MLIVIQLEHLVVRVNLLISQFFGLVGRWMVLHLKTCGIHSIIHMRPLSRSAPKLISLMPLKVLIPSTTAVRLVIR